MIDHEYRNSRIKSLMGSGSHKTGHYSTNKGHGSSTATEQLPFQFRDVKCEMNLLKLAIVQDLKVIARVTV